MESDSGQSNHIMKLANLPVLESLISARSSLEIKYEIFCL